MLWIKRALGFALVVILALATLVFVLENQQGSVLSYLGFVTPQLPVALFVVAAFVCGGVLGLLLGGVMVSRLRYRTRNLEKQIARNAEEIHHLRQLQEPQAPDPAPVPSL